MSGIDKIIQQIEADTDKVCDSVTGAARQKADKIVANAEKEAEKIRAAIPAHHTKIALCVEGKQLSSEGLAKLMGEKTLEGGLCFIIGSSHGLDETLKKECPVKLSFSQMTFPHRIARILLAEQVYRGFTILAGSGYHK